MQAYNINKKQGFTLVEMLVVVVIIGILATALVPRLRDSQARARDSVRKVHINQLITAAESYKTDNGKYYVPPVNAQYSSPGDAPSVAFFYDSSSNALTPITGGGFLQPYLTNIPLDPNNTSSFRDNPQSATYGYYGANFVPSAQKNQFPDGGYGYFVIENGKTYGFFNSVEAYQNANWWNGKVMHCKPGGGCYFAFYPIYVMARTSLERQLCKPMQKGDDSASSATVSDDMYAGNTRGFWSCKTPYVKELINITIAN